MPIGTFGPGTGSKFVFTSEVVWSGAEALATGESTGRDAGVGTEIPTGVVGAVPLSDGATAMGDGLLFGETGGAAPGSGEVASGGG
ncbi:hypothetical protein [Leptothermofonsia sp. ETS-13]|uniref:hypothetical protein n=1 Tax=Leptothermofonsia sp. ETS-13 TaxID=3035696 RepID=UPI003B9E8D4D